MMTTPTLPWATTARALLTPLHPRLLRVRLLATDPLDLTNDPGARFRSVFGRALKHVTCPEGEGPCGDRCFSGLCLFFYGFESPSAAILGHQDRGRSAPHPMIVRVNTGGLAQLRAGQVFDVEVVLFGAARQATSDVVKTIQHAGTLGIGKRRGQFRMEWAVVVDDRCGVVPAHMVEDAPTDQRFGDAPPLEPDHFLESKEVVVSLCSLTRIKERGRFLQTLEFSSIINAIRRRYFDLMDAYGPGAPDWDVPVLLNAASEVKIAESNLSTRHLDRWSSRQRRTVKQGGFSGQVCYIGDLSPFIGLLGVGEMVHIGKGSIMGHGRIFITTKQEPDLEMNGVS